MSADRPAMTTITDDDLDRIDRHSGHCRVFGEVGPDMILVSDLTAQVRRLRAGDRTPTYEQVAQALKDASVGADGPDGLYRTMFLDVATRAVWELLHGQGDEADG